MKFNQEFINKINDLLGDECPKFFDALEKPIQKGITVNTSRISIEKFKDIVDFDISPIELIQNGFYINENKIGKHKFSHLGIIYSQDPSAMYPVELLDIKPGDIVLDLCAAPGGKSIQILEKLNNKGLLVSNEIVYNRAKTLYENITRMGFHNFAITCNSPQDYSKTDLKFDKILVDAPCGGEGMFRREDFDFNSYNNSSIETNAKRQLNILESIKHLLKPNGKIVYSTCTYDTRENEMVVANFLDNNPDFTLLEESKFNSVTSKGINVGNHNTKFCKRRYPHQFKGEGQFMAIMQKSNSIQEEECAEEFTAKGFKFVYKKELQQLKKYILNIINIDKFTIAKREENLYLLPETMLNYNNLNVVTVGTYLGTLSKGVFKIAHNAYHTLPEIFENKIELNNSQIDEYLKGYELNIDSKIEGISVITHLGIPIGGGKIVNGKLKNYYPQNLRNN